jgi:hypothetical protein
MISSRSRPFTSGPGFGLLGWFATFAFGAVSIPNAIAKVFVTSNILGVSAAIHAFDDLGNPLGTIDELSGGKIISAIATDDSRLIAARSSDGFREYAHDGSFVGYLSGLPTTNWAPRVEFDIHGSIYVLGAGAPRRLNADGSPSLTLPGISGGGGIDADAAGNVYVMHGFGGAIGIEKYSPLGISWGRVPIDGVNGDLAIDDAGNVLYAVRGWNDGFGPKSEILAYDISGETPTLFHSFPASPTVAGISFDPHSGHLLAADLFGGYAREMTTTGDIVRTYKVRSDSNPGAHAIDAVALRAPEPSTATMFAIGLACAALRRRNHA